MRKSRIERTAVGLFLIIALAAVAIPAAAQDQQDHEAMMKAWEEATTPGDAHKHLESMVGKWNAVMKMWWQGPDGPVMEEKGTAEFTMILDGRFLRQDWHSQMMGKPVKYLSRTVDENTVIFEIFDLAVGDDYKTIEITYTRM